MKDFIEIKIGLESKANKEKLEQSLNNNMNMGNFNI